jgi:hypothetical protein
VTPSGCCARIGLGMPAHARRRGERCSSVTSASYVATIDGKRITLPLCQLHLRVLVKSDDPSERARTWAPDPPRR